MGVFVVDFKNAFMSIPLHPQEQRFNCAVAGTPISRGRPISEADHRGAEQGPDDPQDEGHEMWAMKWVATAPS